MKKILILFVCVFSIPLFLVSAASIKCTALTSDLSKGSSGSSVLALQNFLQLSGYLSATPNGYFGPATLTAVQKFQSANGIPSVGTIGPITRLAIQVKSCESVQMDPIPNTTTPVSTPTQTNTTLPRSSVTITEPWEGMSITLGKLYTIRWGNMMGTNDSLVLEDEGGTTKGYISYFPGPDGEHLWDVGKVTVGNSTITVDPGKYRIRVQDKLSGVSNRDPKSGLFTISTPDLKVSSIVPDSMVADGKASAVLFGSGFTQSTRVYLDGVYQDSANVLFVSPDGTILVFSVPSTVSRGLHRIVLRNQYGTVANTLSFRIN